MLNLNGKKACEENIPSRETLTEFVNCQNEDGQTVCHLAAINKSEVCDDSKLIFYSRGIHLWERNSL